MGKKTIDKDKRAKDKKVKPVKVMGFDPGTSNFGMGVIRLTPTNFVIDSVGLIKSTVKNMTNQEQIKTPNKAEKERIKKKLITRKDLPSFLPIQDRMLYFYNLISDLFDEEQPDVVVIERFQSRGLKGVTIESVTMMIATICLICLARKVPFYTCVASEWKNKVNRDSKGLLDSYYAHAKPLNIEPHEVDASLIALIIGGKYLEIDTKTIHLPRYTEKLNRWLEKQQ